MPPKTPTNKAIQVDPSKTRSGNVYNPNFPRTYKSKNQSTMFHSPPADQGEAPNTGARKKTSPAKSKQTKQSKTQEPVPNIVNISSQEPTDYAQDLQGACGGVSLIDSASPIEYSGTNFVPPNPVQYPDKDMHNNNKELLDCISMLKDRMRELSLKLKSSEDERQELARAYQRTQQPQPRSVQSLFQGNQNQLSNPLANTPVQRQNQNLYAETDPVPVTPNHSATPRHNVRCEIDKWGISFDGTDVQNFIKQVTQLQRWYDYSDEMVAKYFHLLLKGRAARWFWNYCGN